MHGYGKFAALSNSQEEDEREVNEAPGDDVEVDASCGEYDAVSSPVESWDTTSELSLGLGHREMTTRSDSPGADNPVDEARFEPDVVCENCQGVFPAEGQEGTGRLRVDVANASGCRLCDALLHIWAPESHNERYIDLDFWFVPREGFFMGVLDVIFRPTRQRSAALQTARFGFQMFKDKDAGE
ncbi:hypothetical protein N7494_004854 [Penicillium frequentans]|uniref:Uncharacterized protein n=1 Tax=Penicillium frequentans TaxID=3151616 RepID=A0AAD6D2I6_9EURO|nr:hypothetical protein N7494_004854 [Penicillium glabrum]